MFILYLFSVIKWQAVVIQEQATALGDVDGFIEALRNDFDGLEAELDKIEAELKAAGI